MGFNTTMVIMNDALSTIRDDPQFGERLYDACVRVNQGPQDVAAHSTKGGIDYNAATVIETHHADGEAIVAVGGNYGTLIGMAYYVGDKGTKESQLKILEQLADNMGYSLTKKPERKSK